jgi:hypothetical protein
MEYSFQPHDKLIISLCINILTVHAHAAGVQELQTVTMNYATHNLSNWSTRMILNSNSITKSD